MITETVRVPPNRLMTEEEFVAWCDEDTRAEFVDGKVVVMSPEALIHVEITQFLVQFLGLYLQLRPHGKLLGPGYQVRLREGLRRVPDLLYVTSDHLNRVLAKNLDGSPDMAWEIISPDSVDRDWRDKFDEYEAAGVTEYWIVDPYTCVVRLYRLGGDNKYQLVAEQDGNLRSTVLTGAWIKPDWCWQEPLPNVLDCLREVGALV